MKISATVFEMEWARFADGNNGGNRCRCGPEERFGLSTSRCER
jgi:hypothetical protein